MNVYFESGFVLTLALQQDGHRAADQLLRYVDQGRITSKIPAFSLSEPFATVQYRGNSRNRLVGELLKEIRELGRTETHARLAAELDQCVAELSHVLPTQQRALEAVVLEVSRTSEMLQLDAETLVRAAAYRTAHRLDLPDAVILASVVRDLEAEGGAVDALFVSQNTRDFRRATVQDTLARLNCRYLSDFTNAVRLVERTTRPQDQP